MISTNHPGSMLPAWRTGPRFLLFYLPLQTNSIHAKDIGPLDRTACVSTPARPQKLQVRMTRYPRGRGGVVYFSR